MIGVKKLHENAVIPQRAYDTDAGADLVATSITSKGGNLIYGTGLAFEIPEEYVGLIFARSSVRKKDLILANCVGVIDAGYRGEVMVTFRPSKDGCINMYHIGDKIAQIVIMPVKLWDYTEVDELSTTERGKGGHGSTGK